MPLMAFAGRHSNRNSSFVFSAIIYRFRISAKVENGDWRPGSELLRRGLEQDNIVSLGVVQRGPGGFNPNKAIPAHPRHRRLEVRDFNEYNSLVARRVRL